MIMNVVLKYYNNSEKNKGMFIILKTIVNGVSKLVVSNVAIIFAIMLLPVFLVTENVAFFDHIMDYLFNNKS